MIYLKSIAELSRKYIYICNLCNRKCIPWIINHVVLSIFRFRNRSRVENRQFRRTNTELAWQINGRLGNALRHKRDSFSPLFAGLHAGIAPVTARTSESFIRKMYVPTSAPALRRMYLSWEKTRTRDGDFFAFLLIPSEFSREIILIYGLSKYPPTSWSNERVTSTTTVFPDLPKPQRTLSDESLCPPFFSPFPPYPLLLPHPASVSHTLRFFLTLRTEGLW